MVDTGPLLAAADRRDSAHSVAAKLLAGLGLKLIVLDTVATEADQFIRRRLGNSAGRAFLTALAREEHTTAFLSPGLVKRAAELDAKYADLGLGFVDASLMAYAERHELPILTFDFADFRATEGERGPWRLVVSEDQLRRALAR